MHAMANGLKQQMRRTIAFTVGDQFLAQLYYQRNTEPALPRLEIQLRFFAFEVGVEQKDDFPLNCQVVLDGRPVALPVSESFFF
jgi:hypothetical protein